MIRTELTTITPEVARKLLEKNLHNRPVSRNHLDSLIGRMKRGEWNFNGDTICINHERLIDGQHRLMAVVESGVSIEALIVHGLSSEVFISKDDGRKRSASDALALMGEKNTTTLGASLVLLDRFEHGNVLSKDSYSNARVAEILSRHSQLPESVEKCFELKVIMPPSVASVCHYLFSKLHPEKADQFIKDLKDGESLIKSDPVYILRERLMAARMAKGKTKLASYYIMALTIKVWNARQKNQTVRYLKWTEAGDSRESFPIPV